MFRNRSTLKHPVPARAAAAATKVSILNLCFFMGFVPIFQLFEQLSDRFPQHRMAVVAHPFAQGDEHEFALLDQNGWGTVSRSVRITRSS